MARTQFKLDRLQRHGWIDEAMGEGEEEDEEEEKDIINEPHPIRMLWQDLTNVNNSRMTSAQKVV